MTSTRSTSGTTARVVAADLAADAVLAVTVVSLVLSCAAGAASGAGFHQQAIEVVSVVRAARPAVGGFGDAAASMSLAASFAATSLTAWLRQRRGTGSPSSVLLPVSGMATIASPVLATLPVVAAMGGDIVSPWSDPAWPSEGVPGSSWMMAGIVLLAVLGWILAVSDTRRPDASRPAGPPGAQADPPIAVLGNTLRD